MTILNDKQIRRLCAVPSFVVYERVVQPDMFNNGKNAFGINVYPVEKVSFTHQSSSELNTLKRSTSPTEVGIVSYRPLNDEEKNQFKPMIFPFEPSQVRIKGGGLCNPPEGDDYTGPSIENGFEMRSYRTPIEKVISYGTSSFGYDLRIANEFKIFTNINSTVINPKAFDEGSFIDFIGDVCIIPPNSFVLARSLEYMHIPNDVTGIVLGKSTYARCGISCLATPLEAGWEGHVTLEYANTTPLPAMLFANEGAAQVLFLQGSEAAEVTYAMRSGKYQGQRGITLPKA